MLLLLSCWIIAGVTAEDPPTVHYGVKNSSLCLHVGKSPPSPDYRWIFDKKVIIINNNNVSPDYKDKVDYDPGNHSLCIKNLTETDSGLYEISITSNFRVLTETHRLIVEETVSRPVIRMKVLRSNESAGFCNITVNCSVQDDWAWSVCNGVSCRTSLRSLVKVNITIFTDNRSVVCSGNNHVSTSNASENMEATCFNKTNPEHEKATQSTTVIVIAIAVFTVLCVSILFAMKRLCSSKHNHRQAHASTTQLTLSQPVEADPPPVPRGSTSSSGQSEASYENVESRQPCPTISQRDELGSGQSPKVDSVYCVLEAPNVTASHRKSDSSKNTKGPKMTQAAPASQSAPLDEAQLPTQIDTVYSVLQKPKI